MFLLLSSLLMALVSAYVIVRVIRPLTCSAWLRWLLAFGIFIAAEKILFLHLFVGRSIAQHDLSPLMTFGTGFAQGFVVISALLVLCRDILLLVRWLWRKGTKPVSAPASLSASSPPPSPARALPLWLQPAPLLLLALFCTGWSVWQAAKVPEVRAVSLHVPNLPPALKGLRIVQLSDLHIGPGFDRRWLTQVVQRTNALKPDLVVLTGDIVDGSVSYLRPSIAPLQELQSRYGAFLVVGNHEYYSGLAAWQQEFRRLGITVLNNEHRVIDLRGTPLVVAGVTDPVAAAHNSPTPDPVQALQGRPADAFSLMLSHQPRTAAASAKAGAQLQLSGHTHGGLLLPLQALVARFNTGFVAGPYTLGSMVLYVHSGSALWAGFPIRFGVPSEIADIVLE